MQNRRFPWLALALACLAMACGGDGGGDDALQGEVIAEAVETGGDATPEHDALAEATPEPVPDTATDTATETVPESVAEAEVVEPPPVHPLFDITGIVRLTESWAPGGPQGGSADVRFMTGTYGREHQLWATQGQCEFWEAITPVPCTPECEQTQFCDPQGKCQPYPQRVPAGAVTLTGLAGGPYILNPDDSAWYSSPDLPADLFTPGQPIGVSAAGDASGIGAFQVELAAVADMQADVEGALTLVDGQPFVLTWPPKGDGAKVELQLQIGWHGKPPEAIIYCALDEAQGQVVVPQEFVERFPPFGGMGLFQHPSYLRRVSRQVVEGVHGPIEVVAQSVISFGVIH
jgi:hypothetical protein